MNEDRKFFSKIGFNYLIMAILSLVFQMIIFIIISGYNAEYLGNINIITLISAACNYLLVLPIFLYLMKRLESVKLEKESVGVKKYFQYICITITLMWIGNLIGSIITQLIGQGLGNGIVNPVEVIIENSSFYINLIIISIIAPIVEELMFRKVLIDRTIRYGAKLSILLSALIFALFHGNLSQFFYAFLLGGFFAYVYIKTGKIIYTIILHIIINLFGSVVSMIYSEAIHHLPEVINFPEILSTAYAGDIAIILAYFLVMIIAIIIGAYTILDNYKVELNDEKREIYLEKPVQTVILNFGMICFILFHIWKIIMSILG